MTNKTIHIGPMPPPLGGISVYLYRLSKKNDDSNTLFIDETSIDKYQFLKVLLSGGRNLIVYHSPSLHRRVLLYLASLFSTNRYAIISHGQGLENSYNQSNLLIKWLLKKTILKAEYIQVVGKHLVEFLITVGYEKNKIKVQNAFIEPPLDDEDRILKTYSDKLNNFISTKEKIIIANASALVFYKDGSDLYGLDMCIELTSKLKKEYPNVGFIFALANEKANVEYLNKMKQKIKELEIEQNFYFITGQKELWPLFKKADLMIRPTTTDGDALSIREAMYLGCPAVASDVSDRPKGTIMFKNRDINDLYEKSIKVLKDNGIQY